MYKIGDFSQLGQVTVRTLRHYDRLGLLTPGHIDQFTNYRYYTADQLPRLNRVLALQDLGFSLGDIGQMLEEVTVEKMQTLLTQKQREIEEDLREESARLRRVSARLQQIARDKEPFAYDIVVKSVPEVCLLAVRSTVPDVDAMGEYRQRSLTTLYNWLEQAGVEIGQEIVAYHNRSYTMEQIEMSIGVEVVSGIEFDATQLDATEPAPLSVQKLVLPAATEAASIVVNAPIVNVPDFISALYGWMGGNGYTSAGAHREIHLFGRELDLLYGLTDEALLYVDYVYEILVPIEKF